MFLQRVLTSLKLFFQLLRVNFQMIYGAWRVSSLPRPIITIFGGSRFVQTDPYAQEANELARLFIDRDISVLTGGGPGIMEAASCGALKGGTGKGKGVSMGIGVKHLERKNPCVQQYFELNYFYARKWLLTRYSKAFVVFPGGFGTLDELGEVLTLIQTHQMSRVPIILVGTEYWKSFIDWITDQALQHGLIEPENMKLFVMTDDLNQIYDLVCDICFKPSVKPPKKNVL